MRVPFSEAYEHVHAYSYCLSCSEGGGGGCNSGDVVKLAAVAQHRVFIFELYPFFFGVVFMQVHCLPMHYDSILSQHCRNIGIIVSTKCGACSCSHHKNNSSSHTNM